MDNIRHSVDGTRLIVFPEGHIDSANAQDFEETINELRSRGSYDEIELNCGQLQYISSAGLRVILRLRKDVKAVVLSDVSPEIYEILDVTGFTELVEVQKAYRRVSIEGCEVIGQGANGKVYRIDPETIVKVY
jgi:anti-anti-sigma factor